MRLWPPTWPWFAGQQRRDTRGLWEAVHAGLVFREDRAYRFLHDRIQQAAYSLIADDQRADVHLRIGRALLMSMTADEFTEHLFELANQFNRRRRRADRPRRRNGKWRRSTCVPAQGQSVCGL